MMRKIHRAALAAALKPQLAALEPDFALASAAVAKALGAERRFTFCTDYPGGKAFLLFFPAATASDNYFTVEVAWTGRPFSPESLHVPALQMARLCPWKDRSRDKLIELPAWRLRIEDLCPDEPPSSGSFEFSTAASRYCAALFAMALGGNTKAAEAQAFALFQTSLTEEAALTDEVAAQELAPAISLCLDAIVTNAQPMFLQASAVCQSAGRP